MDWQRLADGGVTLRSEASTGYGLPVRACASSGATCNLSGISGISGISGNLASIAMLLLATLMAFATLAVFRKHKV